MNVSDTRSKVFSPVGVPARLRFTSDTLESVTKTHPIEAAILRLMLADGRAQLVDPEAAE